MLPTSLSPSPLFPLLRYQKEEVEKNASKFQLGFNCDDDSWIHWRRIRINRYSNWYSHAYSQCRLSSILIKALKRSDLQHSLRFLSVFGLLLLFIYYYCVYYWIRFQFRFQFRWFFQGACLQVTCCCCCCRRLDHFRVFNLGGLSKNFNFYFWRRVQQFNCDWVMRHWDLEWGKEIERKRERRDRRLKISQSMFEIQ